MIEYFVKSASNLSKEEIQTIAKHLDMNHISIIEFRETFSSSDFHLLKDNDTLLSFARINYDFILEIDNKHYNFAEFVGFLSIVKRTGNGSKLLMKIIENLKKNDVECIGFCEMPLRSFYEINAIEILYDKASFIKEYVDGEWLSTADDDILSINLSYKNKILLSQLSISKPAFFIENI